MKPGSTIFSLLRRIDEEAASANPYYQFANDCFDRFVDLHRRDLVSLVGRVRGGLRRSRK